MDSLYGGLDFLVVSSTANAEVLGVFTDRFLTINQLVGLRTRKVVYRQGEVWAQSTLMLAFVYHLIDVEQRHLTFVVLVLTLVKDVVNLMFLTLRLKVLDKVL